MSSSPSSPRSPRAVFGPPARAPTEKLKNLLDTDYERIAVKLACEVSELKTLREHVEMERRALWLERKELEDARAHSRRELWELQHARLELESAHTDDAEWHALRTARVELDAAGAALAARARDEDERAARAREAIEGERAELEKLRARVGDEWSRLAKYRAALELCAARMELRGANRDHSALVETVFGRRPASSRAGGGTPKTRTGDGGPGSLLTSLSLAPAPAIVRPAWQN